MNKIELQNQLKSIAENIFDPNTPVYEQNILKIFQYKNNCSIVTFRQGLKNFREDNYNVENIIKLLNQNFEKR